VATGKSKEYRTPEFAIALRSISEHFLWDSSKGKHATRSIELLSQRRYCLGVYLTLQSGLTPHLDEIELHSLDKQKLVKYANKYPGTVRNALANSLAFEHFAA
jgi:hypothetical protein